MKIFSEGEKMSTVSDIQFPSSTQFGFLLLGIVYLLLPVTAFLILRKYRAAQWIPVMLGAIIYLFTTRLNDIMIGALFSSANQQFKIVMASLTVGIFEESGRYFAMKYPLAYYRNTGDALSLAIGHGGTECIIRAVRAFQSFGYGNRFNDGGILSFTAGHTDAEAATITQTLTDLSSQTFTVNFLQCLCAASALLVHFALSVLILHAVRYESKRKLFLAIGLHILLNGTAFDFSFFGQVCSKFLTLILEVAMVMFIMKKLDGKALLMEIRDNAFFQSDDIKIDRRRS